MKPLLPNFSGHVKNSDEVIHRPSQLNTEQLLQNNYAFGLDIISLYTIVPAHPAIDIILSYIISKNLYCYRLIATGIHQLLSIIVDNTYFTYNVNTYKQITGLPMGSSISDILAISYMDQLERRALSICPSCIFFTRYIDDILMLTSSSEEATAIYEKFQNIDRHIQFKIEHLYNTGSLLLLDFKIQISSTGKIYTSFYRKPTAKNLFVHFKSALPLSAKINYIRNEIKRIHNRCSEERYWTSLSLIFG